MVKVLRPDWDVVEEPLEDWVAHNVPVGGAVEQHNHLKKFYDGQCAETSDEHATDFRRLQASGALFSFNLRPFRAMIFLPRPT
jgi:hypothetical protein